MTTVSVPGFTTPDIHATIASAGVNGTVVFPNMGLANAVYDADQVTASVGNQTWIMERGVKLLRSPSAPPSAVITQTASGLKLVGGILDGNRGVNNQPGNGIYSAVGGNDLELDGVTIQNICSWGIATQDCRLKMRRSTIKNTTFACLFWLDTSGPGTEGPDIDDCEFDRTLEGSTPGNGLVIIGSSRLGGGFYTANPRFTNNRCRMQYPGSFNSVLFECKGSTGLRCTGNVMIGGHTSLSIDKTELDIISGNVCRYPEAYGIEYCGDQGNVFGNNIHGVGAGTVCGIIGNACTNSKAVGNIISNCATRFQVVNGGQLQDISNT